MTVSVKLGEIEAVCSDQACRREVCHAADQRLQPV